MKSLKYVIVSLVLALGFAAPVAHAQDGAPRSRQGGGGGGDFAARLFEGITLTADQKGKIDAINADTQKQVQALAQADRRTKGREIRMEANGKIREILNEDQRKQFDKNAQNMPRPGGGGNPGAGGAGGGNDKAGKGGKGSGKGGGKGE